MVSSLLKLTRGDQTTYPTASSVVTDFSFPDQTVAGARKLGRTRVGNTAPAGHYTAEQSLAVRLLDSSDYTTLVDVIPTTYDVNLGGTLWPRTTGADTADYGVAVGQSGYGFVPLPDDMVLAAGGYRTPLLTVAVTGVAAVTAVTHIGRACSRLTVDATGLEQGIPTRRDALRLTINPYKLTRPLTLDIPLVDIDVPAGYLYVPGEWLAACQACLPGGEFYGKVQYSVVRQDFDTVPPRVQGRQEFWLQRPDGWTANTQVLLTADVSLELQADDPVATDEGHVLQVAQPGYIDSDGAPLTATASLDVQGNDKLWTISDTGALGCLRRRVVDGQVIYSTVDLRAVAPPKVRAENSGLLFSKVRSNDFVVAALTATGNRLYVWGVNKYGLLEVPTAVDASYATNGYVSDIHDFDLAEGHIVVIKASTKALAGWGCTFASTYYTLNSLGVETGGGLGVGDMAVGPRHTLLVRNGTVEGYGDNTYGQCDPPALLVVSLAYGAPDDAVALDVKTLHRIAAGLEHSIAIDSSTGFPVCWGNNDHGECDVPSFTFEVTAVAAGLHHNIALDDNGYVTCWGDDTYGQSTVPAELSSVTCVQIGAGDNFSAALTESGELYIWGDNARGQCDVPLTEGNPFDGSVARNPMRFSNFYCGSDHIIAVRDDGSFSYDDHPWHSTLAALAYDKLRGRLNINTNLHLRCTHLAAVQENSVVNLYDTKTGVLVYTLTAVPSTTLYRISFTGRSSLRIRLNYDTADNSLRVEYSINAGSTWRTDAWVDTDTGELVDVDLLNTPISVRWDGSFVPGYWGLGVGTQCINASTALQGAGGYMDNDLSAAVTLGFDAAFIAGSSYKLHGNLVCWGNTMAWTEPAYKADVYEMVPGRLQLKPGGYAGSEASAAIAPLAPLQPYVVTAPANAMGLGQPAALMAVATDLKILPANQGYGGNKTLCLTISGTKYCVNYAIPSTDEEHLVTHIHDGNLPGHYATWPDFESVLGQQQSRLLYRGDISVYDLPAGYSFETVTDVDTVSQRAYPTLQKFKWTGSITIDGIACTELDLTKAIAYTFPYPYLYLPLDSNFQYIELTTANVAALASIGLTVEDALPVFHQCAPITNLKCVLAGKRMSYLGTRSSFTSLQPAGYKGIANWPSSDVDVLTVRTGLKPAFMAFGQRSLLVAARGTTVYSDTGVPTLKQATLYRLGDNSYGQLLMPYEHGTEWSTEALSDGSIRTGFNLAVGQQTIPATFSGLQFDSVSCSTFHNLAVTVDGYVKAWGSTKSHNAARLTGQLWRPTVADGSALPADCDRRLKAYFTTFASDGSGLSVGQFSTNRGSMCTGSASLASLDSPALISIASALTGTCQCADFDTIVVYTKCLVDDTYPVFDTSATGTDRFGVNLLRSGSGLRLQARLSYGGTTNSSYAPLASDAIVVLKITRDPVNDILKVSGRINGYDVTWAGQASVSVGRTDMLSGFHVFGPQQLRTDLQTKTWSESQLDLVADDSTLYATYYDATVSYKRAMVLSGPSTHLITDPLVEFAASSSHGLAIVPTTYLSATLTSGKAIAASVGFDTVSEDDTLRFLVPDAETLSGTPLLPTDAKWPRVVLPGTVGDVAALCTAMGLTYSDGWVLVPAYQLQCWRYSSSVSANVDCNGSPVGPDTSSYYRFSRVPCPSTGEWCHRPGANNQSVCIIDQYAAYPDPKSAVVYDTTNNKILMQTAVDQFGATVSTSASTAVTGSFNPVLVSTVFQHVKATGTGSWTVPPAEIKISNTKFYTSTELTSFKHAIAIAAGHQCSFAITATSTGATSGTLVAWGANTDSVVSGIPSLSTAAKIGARSHTAAAVTSAGALHVWGSDSQGQVTDKPSGTFSQLAVGDEFVAATLADGTLRAWGAVSYAGPAKASSIKAGAQHAIAVLSAPLTTPDAYAIGDLFGIGTDVDGCVALEHAPTGGIAANVVACGNGITVALRQVQSYWAGKVSQRAIALVHNGSATRYEGYIAQQANLICPSVLAPDHPYLVDPPKYLYASPVANPSAFKQNPNFDCAAAIVPGDLVGTKVTKVLASRLPGFNEGNSSYGSYDGYSLVITQDGQLKGWGGRHIPAGCSESLYPLNPFAAALQAGLDLGTAKAVDVVANNGTIFVLTDASQIVQWGDPDVLGDIGGQQCTKLAVVKPAIQDRVGDMDVHQPGDYQFGLFAVTGNLASSDAWSCTLQLDAVRAGVRTPLRTLAMSGRKSVASLAMPVNLARQLLLLDTITATNTDYDTGYSLSVTSTGCRHRIHTGSLLGLDVSKLSQSGAPSRPADLKVFEFNGTLSSAQWQALSTFDYTDCSLPTGMPAWRLSYVANTADIAGASTLRNSKGAIAKLALDNSTGTAWIDAPIFDAAADLTFTPTDIPNLCSWYAPDSITGTVTRWADKQATFDLLPVNNATASLAVTVSGERLNSYDGVVFSGGTATASSSVGGYLAAATDSRLNPNNCTVLVVAKPYSYATSPTNRRGLVCCSSTTAHASLRNVHNTAASYVQSGTTSNTASTALTLGSAGIFALRCSSPTAALYRYAGQDVTLNTPTSISAVPSSSFTLGRTTHQPSTTEGGVFRGAVYEVLVYNRALTVTELQQLEGYLAHKYGITSTLPVGHPYKSTAPTAVGTGTVVANNGLQSIWSQTLLDLYPTVTPAGLVPTDPELWLALYSLQIGYTAANSPNIGTSAIVEEDYSQLLQQYTQQQLTDQIIPRIGNPVTQAAGEYPAVYAEVALTASKAEDSGFMLLYPGTITGAANIPTFNPTVSADNASLQGSVQGSAAIAALDASQFLVSRPMEAVRVTGRMAVIATTPTLIKLLDSVQLTPSMATYGGANCFNVFNRCLDIDPAGVSIYTLKRISAQQLDNTMNIAPVTLKVAKRLPLNKAITGKVDITAKLGVASPLGGRIAGQSKVTGVVAGKLNMGSIKLEPAVFVGNCQAATRTKSKIIQAGELGSVQEVPVGPATGPMDYEVWATHWQGDQMFTYATTSQRWGGASYSTISVVPMILFYGSGYNGYRTLGVNDISDIPTLQRNQFLDRIRTIPHGRRAINEYYFTPDGQAYTNALTDYYKATADGTTYSGGTFLTPWMDVNRADAKASMRAFLNFCLANDVTFEYWVVDKEYHSYWYLNGLNGVGGHPGTAGPAGEPASDARVISSIVADPRFNTKLHPTSGMTFAQEFLDNYKRLSNQPNLSLTAEEVLAPYIGVTTSSGYVPPTKFWAIYNETGGTNDDSPFKPNGAKNYDLFHRVVPAWNSVAFNWHQNYTVRGYTQEVFAEFIDFTNTKATQYDVYPVSVDESPLLSESNNDRLLQRVVHDSLCGHALYGTASNSIFPSSAMPTPTGDHNGAAYVFSAPYTSGYRLNPINDHERYDWCNSWTTQVETRGTTDLVRYPQEVVLVNNPPNYPLTGSLNKFYQEYAYKMTVDLLKRIRTAQRSDPTFWERFVPWFTNSTWPGSAYAYLDDNSVQAGKPYWNELFYHALLAGAKFIQYYDSAYTPAHTAEIHAVLDEWRTISNNSRAQPCTNSAGSVLQPVDRIELWKAFEQPFMSGGQLLKSGKYLWRITVPPKFFYATGSVTLRSVSGDSDIPATIVISGNDPATCRGVWVKRNVPTPPVYTIVS